MKLTGNINVNMLLKLAGGTALFFVGKHYLDKWEEENSKSQTATDKNVSIAQSLRQAMNPTGNSIFMNTDGTNEEEIFTLAKQIDNLQAVRDHYKRNFGSDLYDDLQKELSPEDYQKFLGLATKGKTGNVNYGQTRSDIPAFHWLVTNADANIRRTPKKESQWIPGNNIVKLVPKGKAIGVTTGKFVYREGDDVVFIEFFSVDSKQKKRYYFVAKSQVDIITREEKEKQTKSKKIQFELLEGLQGTEHQTEVITQSPTLILNEEFKVIGSAGKNVIIGYPLMELKTNKGTFIKIETVQGFVRWVNANTVKVHER